MSATHLLPLDSISLPAFRYHQLSHTNKTLHCTTALQRQRSRHKLESRNRLEQESSNNHPSPKSRRPHELLNSFNGAQGGAKLFNCLSTRGPLM